MYVELIGVATGRVGRRSRSRSPSRSSTRDRTCPTPCSGSSSRRSSPSAGSWPSEGVVEFAHEAAVRDGRGVPQHGDAQHVRTRVVAQPVRRRRARPATGSSKANRRLVEERLGLLAPFRRRLVEVPLGLDLPYWIEDPDFDLDFHVRHHAVPPPGTPQQLSDVISRIHARPLDRVAAAVGDVRHRRRRRRTDGGDIHQGPPRRDRRRRRHADARRPARRRPRRPSGLRAGAVASRAPSRATVS